MLTSSGCSWYRHCAAATEHASAAAVIAGELPRPLAVTLAGLMSLLNLLSCGRCSDSDRGLTAKKGRREGKAETGAFALAATLGAASMRRTSSPGLWQRAGRLNFSSWAHAEGGSSPIHLFRPRTPPRSARRIVGYARTACGTGRRRLRSRCPTRTWEPPISRRAAEPRRGWIRGPKGCLHHQPIRAPALSLKEFASYSPECHHRRQRSRPPPSVSNDGDRLVNLGSNRWAPSRRLARPGRCGDGSELDLGATIYRTTTTFSAARSASRTRCTRHRGT